MPAQELERSLDCEHIAPDAAQALRKVYTAMHEMEPEGGRYIAQWARILMRPNLRHIEQACDSLEQSVMGDGAEATLPPEDQIRGAPPDSLWRLLLVALQTGLWLSSSPLLLDNCIKGGRPRKSGVKCTQGMSQALCCFHHERGCKKNAIDIGVLGLAACPCWHGALIIKSCWRQSAGGCVTLWGMLEV